jgi:hypothetical protein
MDDKCFVVGGGVVGGGVVGGGVVGGGVGEGRMFPTIYI